MPTRRHSGSRARVVAALALSVVLASCQQKGGGGAGAPPPPAPPPAPAPAPKKPDSTTTTLGLAGNPYQKSKEDFSAGNVRVSIYAIGPSDWYYIVSSTKVQTVIDSVSIKGPNFPSPDCTVSATSYTLVPEIVWKSAANPGASGARLTPPIPTATAANGGASASIGIHIHCDAGNKPNTVFATVWMDDKSQTVVGGFDGPYKP